jgi:NAD(P)-dependent dehydrogenase (short-subunit alcohol dehydrogenase family)
MTFSLAGKVVLVTGAGAGIGRAVAQQMALAGGQIAVCDINKTSAEETAHSIVGDGGKAVAITADVGDIGQIDRMVGEATTALGTVNEPEDIADLCIYLASDAPRNITGQSFNIDGGLIMS